MTNILFICSGAIDRSPCAASLFDNSEDYKARHAGIGLLTENPVTKDIIDWADLIICMELEHKAALFEQFDKARQKDIEVLNVSNDYLRYDLELEKILRERLGDYL